MRGSASPAGNRLSPKPREERRGGNSNATDPKTEQCADYYIYFLGSGIGSTKLVRRFHARIKQLTSSSSGHTDMHPVMGITLAHPFLDYV